MLAPPARPSARSVPPRWRAVLALAGALVGGAPLPHGAAALGAAALGAGALAGCVARGKGGPVPEQEATTVRVRNQSFLDHNIYVLNGGARSRLGTVSGNSTVVLRIPPSFVQPGSLVRFLADPIGSSTTPVSDQLVVSPGDEVQLTIPPR